MRRSSPDSATTSANVQPPPPPLGATPPATSHSQWRQSMSSVPDAPTNGTSSTTAEGPSRRRSKQREIIVVPPSSSSSYAGQPSNALRPVTSNGSIDSVASASQGGGNKLSKWLSRSSSSNSNPHSNTLAPHSHTSHPIISISPSSSAQSNLSTSSGASADSGSAKLQKRRGSADSKTSVSTTNSGSAVSRRFAGLSLEGSKRSSRQEELGEWANADLEEDVTGEGDDAEGKSTKSGVGRFSLKRSRSNLKMFGRGRGGSGGAEERDLSPTASFTYSATRPRSRDSDSPSLINHNSPYNLGSSPSQGSASLLDLASPSTPNPMSQSQGPTAAGRIGGWFNSILHSSGASASASHLPLSSTPSDPPASPARHSSFHPSPTSRSINSTSDATVAATGSPSKFSLGSAGSFRLGGGGSPKKGSGGQGSNGSNGAPAAGRLGPLDRMLDKAVQFFLDTDSQADRCEEEIWVLGVRHEGWRPEVSEDDEVIRDEVDGGPVGESRKESKRRSWQNGGSGGVTGKGKKNGGGKKRSGGRGGDSVDLDARSLTTSSSTSLPSSSASASPSPEPRGAEDPFSSPASTPSTTNGWPHQFYLDFYSRVALTYRTGFPPIPCSPPSSGAGGMLNSLSMSIGRGGSRGGSAGGNGDGLSSDTGWGCMLRTGQSLLANALITVHLGRDWRRTLPSPSSATGAPSSPTSPSAATYARILSLFLDDPSPLSPFSVHRFALMGKQLGKEVGEWFGPSTAAGAIKALVNAFEPAGMRVVSVGDGSVYKSEVRQAALGATGRWEKPVLVLIGLRLGIDGVNPIYHEAIKGIFRLPQSVGIAGGRPSSSYYFVGAQANSLFYIDPHHPRSAVPLRPPPDSAISALAQQIPIAPPSTTGHPQKESNISDSFITVSPPLPATPTALRHSTPTRAPAERVLLDDYFVDAYSDSQLRSYHCDKVRKMALSSLDPSMLVGFLIQDERDWEDFSERIKLLSQATKPIFSIADSPPAWMRRPSGTAPPPLQSADSTPMRAPHSSTSPSLLGGGGDESDEYSEPEDWELDSTDASAASSSAAVPLAGAEEEWEVPGSSARTGPSPSPSPPSPSPSPSPSPVEVEVESIRRVEVDDEASWHSAESSSPPPSTFTSTATRPPLPSIRSNNEEGLVVVDTPSTRMEG